MDRRRAGGKAGLLQLSQSAHVVFEVIGRKAGQRGAEAALFAVEVLEVKGMEALRRHVGVRVLIREGLGDEAVNEVALGVTVEVGFQGGGTFPFSAFEQDEETGEQLPGQRRSRPICQTGTLS